MVKNLGANARDAGSVPEWERSPGAGNGHPLQYSHLENSMDRGALWGQQDHKDLDTVEHKHIADLQCCARFWSTAKLFNYMYFKEYMSNIYIYIYIYIRFFSILVNLPF